MTGHRKWSEIKRSADPEMVARVLRERKIDDAQVVEGVYVALEASQARVAALEAALNECEDERAYLSRTLSNYSRLNTSENREQMVAIREELKRLGVNPLVAWNVAWAGGRPFTSIDEVRQSSDDDLMRWCRRGQQGLSKSGLRGLRQCIGYPAQPIDEPSQNTEI